MNYARTAYEKAVELEKRYNKLISQDSKVKSDYIVLDTDFTTVTEIDNNIEFNFTKKTAGNLSVSVLAVVTDSVTETITCELYLNGSYLCGKSVSYSGTNCAITFGASARCIDTQSNTLTVKFLTNNQSYSLAVNGLTLTIYGTDVSNTAVCVLSGVAQGGHTYYAVGEGKSIKTYIDGTTSLYDTLTLSSAITKAQLAVLYNKLYYVYLQDGLLYMKEVKSSVSAINIAKSVTAFSIAQCGGVVKLYIVIRNKLYCRNVYSDNTLSSLTLSAMLSTEKFTNVCLYACGSYLYATLETQKRIYIMYSADNGDTFNLDRRINSGDLVNANVSNNIMLLCQNNNGLITVTKVFLRQTIVPEAQYSIYADCGTVVDGNLYIKLNRKLKIISII